MCQIGFYYNDQRKPVGQGESLAGFCAEEALRARNFHASFREYEPTPLIALSALAKDLGVGQIFIKDESRRFGLNAFKVLGGSYAIGRLLADRLERPIETLGRDELCSDGVRKQIGDMVFVTATDGNHGRGVAWTAQQLGQKAVVFMPAGSARIRADNIRKTGARCFVTNVNYDDAVRIADKYAADYRGVLVQDTAWEGYEEIPRFVMQGYMTLASEALEQLRAAGVRRPTHLFLQAGVGSFAASALGYFAAQLGDDAPLAVIVEPDQAACIFKSMKAQDGAIHPVAGELRTIMAGLACGEPSAIGWGALRDYAAASLSCPDFIAANGMRILAAPRPGDAAIVSGESGAVTTGALDYVMSAPEADGLRARLGLDGDSVVLLISTEGDTSPELYRDVVWRGKCPAP